MAWNIVPNCHVQVFQNIDYGTAGITPDYDGDAQLLTPLKPSLGAMYEHRVAIKPNVLSNHTKTILGDNITKWSLILFVDDDAAQSYYWYQITDVSISTASAGGGLWLVDALFLTFESLTSI